MTFSTEAEESHYLPLLTTFLSSLLIVIYLLLATRSKREWYAWRDLVGEISQQKKRTKTERASDNIKKKRYQKKSLSIQRRIGTS